MRAIGLKLMKSNNVRGANCLPVFWTARHSPGSAVISVSHHFEYLIGATGGSTGQAVRYANPVETIVQAILLQLMVVLCSVALVRLGRS